MDYPVVINEQVPRQEALGFLARSVYIDNNTNSWMYEGNTRSYIAPQTIGNIISLPFRCSQMDVRWIAPPNFSQPGASGGTANVRYTDLPVPPVPGISQASAASSNNGTGSDKALVVNSGTTTLTRDGNYSSVTVAAGATLNAAGFIIRCTGTVTNNGTISNVGANAVGGNAGAGAPSGTMAGGGAGSNVAAINGSNSPAQATAQSGGGNGGTGTSGVNPGKGGLGGASWQSVAVPASFTGGGGGGPGNGPNNAGGGGGGGGPITIFCETTVGNGTVSTVGGNGANAASPSDGGSGGGGGPIFIAAHVFSDTWTLTAAGGAGVNGLGGGANGTAGTGGSIIRSQQ